MDVIFVILLGVAYLPIALLITLLIMTSTDAALRDVAVDGIMCVEGKKTNTTGKIQSVQWISISIAGLLTGVGGGFIAEKWGYKMGFLLLLPVYLAVGLFALLYKEEDPVKLQVQASFISDMKRLFSHKRLLIIGLFIFLYNYSPSFGTPLFFIQRDSFKWSKIWIGWLGTISTVFSIAGALFYFHFSQRINIKKWLYFSVFVGAAVTLCYLYYTPITAVVYEVIFSLMGMFIFLMLLDFMARNSVKGLEATSFAFLCSASNIASVSSNLTGAMLLPKVGLNWLIVISSVTSFLCLPLINKIK
jgi:hypothetical protein